MTTAPSGKLIPFDVALQRADKRLAERKQREDNARRKLLPLIVIVCETYRVSVDDLLDSQNKHPTVALARDITRWLGYSKLHVGTTYLAAALNQHRVGSAHAIARIRKKLEGDDFKRQVDLVERLLDAAVQK